MKHTGSSLPDLLIDYVIDHHQQKVTATISHFDSALLQLFFKHLGEEGIPCVVDERGFNPEPAWAVFVVFAGSRFLARVVVLPYATTVSLEAVRDSDRLTPSELTELKALSLKRGNVLKARFGLKGLS